MQKVMDSAVQINVLNMKITECLQMHTAIVSSLGMGLARKMVIRNSHWLPLRLGKLIILDLYYSKFIQIRVGFWGFGEIGRAHV